LNGKNTLSTYQKTPPNSRVSSSAIERCRTNNGPKGENPEMKILEDEKPSAGKFEHMKDIVYMPVNTSELHNSVPLTIGKSLDQRRPTR
jgi:hypothetical protein